MNQEAWQKWFETLWADREEHWYPQFFGKLGEGIYTLTPKIFAELGETDVDPRHLTIGVLESPPNEQHGHWLYVTSGLSNPWGDGPGAAEPEALSGLGLELTMHTPAKAPWAIRVLQWLMAVQVLVATGKMEGHLLEYADRVPLGSPLGDSTGALDWLVIAPPEEISADGGAAAGYPARFTLASGHVDLMLVLAVTAREADFSRTQGIDALASLLRHHGVYPVSDPARPAVL